MACFSIQNVRLAGISASLPAQEQDNAELELLTERERGQLLKTVGIRTRRIAPAGMCASDLCVAAAERLLQSLNWKAEAVEALVYVTQTPDHSIPGTATQIHERLGLPKSALALDINQGCAGYVYGLSTLAALLATGGFQKALLLVGDTITHVLSPQDKSTVPIFSDAGSATALEFAPGAAPMHFNLQSDGKGYQAICTPEGGTRKPMGPDSHTITEQEGGLMRAPAHMAMRGLDIFNFALREVAPNLKELLAFAKRDISDPDHFVFHQANLLLNESIRKKLRIPREKTPYTLPHFGNTSCATIPVTLVDQLSDKLRSGAQTLALSGFGVGLSWGSALVQTEALACPPMLEL